MLQKWIVEVGGGSELLHNISTNYCGIIHYMTWINSCQTVFKNVFTVCKISLLREKFASVFSFLLQIVQIKCFSVGLGQDSMVHKRVQMLQQLLCEKLSLHVQWTKRYQQNPIRGCETLQSSTWRLCWTVDCLERTEHTIWTKENR